MAKQKKMVEDITSMDVDFAKWYTDICKKAELVSYTSVKGCMVIRPYGYAIWEHIQSLLDGYFKETGHENVNMPMFIPEGELTSLRKRTTLSKLSSGSPMPMSTRWFTGFPAALSLTMNSSSISQAFRFRFLPPMVEAQKLQPMAQPTWVDMQRELP